MDGGGQGVELPEGAGGGAVSEDEGRQVVALPGSAHGWERGRGANAGPHTTQTALAEDAPVELSNLGASPKALVPIPQPERDADFFNGLP